MASNTGRNRGYRKEPVPVLTLMDSRCSPDVLASWADSDNPDVKIAIASNRNCPVAIQIRFAQSEGSKVCRQLAENPSLHHQALSVLRTRTDDETIMQLLVDYSLHTDAMLRACAQSTNTTSRRLAARHSSAQDVLYLLCADPVLSIREVAAGNEACPDEGRVAAMLLK